MNDASHRNVPVGTVAGHEGQPVTIRRDYDHVVIPAMELDAAGLNALPRGMEG